MIGLGLLAFFDPLALGLGISYVVTAGLGIYGISSIITYFRSKASYRSGWSLANGIVLTLLSGLMLWTALGNPYGSVELLSTLTFAIGFFTLLSGIEQIQAFSALRKASVPGAGLMLTSGIMNLFLTLIIYQPSSGLVWSQRDMGALPDHVRYRTADRVFRRKQYPIPHRLTGGGRICPKK